MSKRILWGLILSFSTFCSASNLKLSQPVFYMEGGSAIAVFNLQWENAWHNAKNHDAIWLFFKSLPAEGNFRHIQVLQDGHEVVSHFSSPYPSIQLEPSKDGMGLFVIPKLTFRGDVHLCLKITLEPKSFENIRVRTSELKVYGIEMVNIPGGAFFAGDTAKEAIQHGSFFMPGKRNGKNDFVKILSETQEIAVSKKGDLFYEAPEGYEGDQQGVVPASYPKGVQAFYIMKYEPTEGQYISFLNSLSSDQQETRSMIGEANYADQGGSIFMEEGNYVTPFPSKSCPFMSWDDAMAYADWAGLRPMTELEFTKASRGSNPPQSLEFPWGKASKYKVQRLPDRNGVLQMTNGWGENQLTDDNRAYFGASYYWVMDLAGGMWERVVSLGHPKGRSFQGKHGNGQLAENGNADVEDWPTGSESSGGVGYRGGGFYGYKREYHQFNPYSPISFRPYGGWHGTKRTRSYGARFVRTQN